jgi:hypothetical protein
MAACRVRPVGCPQTGVHPRPDTQNEDTSGIRILLAGFAPLALGAATGDPFRRQDQEPVRHALWAEKPGQGLAIQDDPVGGRRVRPDHAKYAVTYLESAGVLTATWVAAGSRMQIGVQSGQR